MTVQWEIKKTIKGQSSDLNFIEMLWWDIKRAVHEWIPANLHETKQHFMDEWAEIPP